MRRQTLSGFCGPAFLQHFINIYGYEVTQESIAQTISSIDAVINKGSTPEELGIALNNMFPDLVLWLKYNALWQDVKTLTDKYSENVNHGVALDIQGFCIDQDMLIPGSLEFLKLVTGINQSETIVLDRQELIKVTYQEDNGHYIVVTKIFDNGQVRFLDPSFTYPRYIHQKYILMRWWDVDTDIYKQPLMIVTKKEDTYPKNLGMEITPA